MGSVGLNSSFASPVRPPPKHPVCRISVTTPCLFPSQHLYQSTIMLFTCLWLIGFLLLERPHCEGRDCGYLVFQCLKEPNMQWLCVISLLNDERCLWVSLSGCRIFSSLKGLGVARKSSVGSNPHKSKAGVMHSVNLILFSRLLLTFSLSLSLPSPWGHWRKRRLWLYLKWGWYAGLGGSLSGLTSQLHHSLWLCTS